MQQLVSAFSSEYARSSAEFLQTCKNVLATQRWKRPELLTEIEQLIAEIERENAQAQEQWRTAIAQLGEIKPDDDEMLTERKGDLRAIYKKNNQPLNRKYDNLVAIITEYINNTNEKNEFTIHARQFKVNTDRVLQPLNQAVGILDGRRISQFAKISKIATQFFGITRCGRIRKSTVINDMRFNITLKSTFNLDDAYHAKEVELGKTYNVPADVSTMKEYLKFVIDTLDKEWEASSDTNRRWTLKEKEWREQLRSMSEKDIQNLILARVYNALEAAIRTHPHLFLSLTVDIIVVVCQSEKNSKAAYVPSESNDHFIVLEKYVKDKDILRIAKTDCRKGINDFSKADYETFVHELTHAFDRTLQKNHQTIYMETKKLFPAEIHPTILAAIMRYKDLKTEGIAKFSQKIRGYMQFTQKNTWAYFLTVSEIRGKFFIHPPKTRRFYEDLAELHKTNTYDDTTKALARSYAGSEGYIHDVGETMSWMIFMNKLHTIQRRDPTQQPRTVVLDNGETDVKIFSLEGIKGFEEKYQSSIKSEPIDTVMKEGQRGLSDINWRQSKYIFWADYPPDDPQNIVGQFIHWFSMLSFKDFLLEYEKACVAFGRTPILTVDMLRKLNEEKLTQERQKLKEAGA